MTAARAVRVVGAASAPPVKGSVEDAAARLGISIPAVGFAVQAGLLTRTTRGTLHQEVTATAEADLPGFRQRLAEWVRPQITETHAALDVAADPVQALCWAAGVLIGCGSSGRALRGLRTDQRISKVADLVEAADWSPTETAEWVKCAQQIVTAAGRLLVRATDAAAQLQVVSTALTDELPRVGDWVPRAGVQALVGSPWLTAARAEYEAWQRNGMPVRRGLIGQVTFHTGPTNSGKTHDALLELGEVGAGVYAAPLRQLAYEAYLRLSARLGEDQVGLATGEEEINPGAPIVCCTTEKAPDRGRVLVVDEAHWITDRDRGHHWTRLLLGAAYESMHIICAPEALGMLQPLVADARDTRVVTHERLSRLHWQPDPVTAETITDQTVVVAFSRNSVYAVAAQLHAHRPDRVGVLYGALPPETRRAVIADFAAGRLDVLVTTDVIGHGINLPAQTVLFAETSKFDGFQIRPLRTWEAAQIAGRAGRYGFGEENEGTAGIFTGLHEQILDPRLVQQAVEVARGDQRSDLYMLHPRMRPELRDLRAVTMADLSGALESWQSWASVATRGLPVTTDRIGEYQRRLDALAATSADLMAATDAVTGWRLLNMPIAFNPPKRIRWLTMAQAVLAHRHDQPVDTEGILPSLPVDGSVSNYEAAAAHARDAASMLRIFPGVGGLDPDDAWLLEACAADEITARLPEEIRSSRAGLCASCGTPVAASHVHCRTCHRATSWLPLADDAADDLTTSIDNAILRATAADLAEEIELGDTAVDDMA